MRRFSRLIILATSVGLIFSTGVIGQDSTKSSIRTVFGKKKVNYLGLYFAPEYQFGQLGGVFTSMSGASIMLQFNKKLAVGFTGFGSFNRQQSTNINGSFAGLKAEYTVNPNAPIHLSFPLMVGVGGTGFRFGEFGEHHDGFRGDRNGGMLPDGTTNPNFSPSDDDDDNFSNLSKVIQPGIVAEANLARFAKFFVGANYRFAFNSAGFDADYKGFSANVGVKLGVFDYALKGKKTNNKKHLKE